MDKSVESSSTLNPQGLKRLTREESVDLESLVTAPVSKVKKTSEGAHKKLVRQRTAAESDHLTSPFPTTPSEERKDQRTVLKGPVDFSKEVLPRLKRPDGSAGFLPLSIGRGFNDFWWRPTGCALIPSSEVYILMDIIYFIEDAKALLQPTPLAGMCTVRCDWAELTNVCYLYDRFLKYLHSEKKKETIGEWQGRMMQAALESSDVHNNVGFAKAVFDLTFAQACTRIPEEFGIYFQKRPFNQIINYPAAASRVENINSIVGDACNGEFKYEMRLRIMYLDEAAGKMKRKGIGKNKKKELLAPAPTPALTPVMAECIDLDEDDIPTQPPPYAQEVK
ncbi:TPA_asm: hypothetical protein [Sheep rumen MELD virus]|nr:TPA_asm: hypothetical protein [Sheep rumen MELD virus]